MKKTAVDLNCDMGESFGTYKKGNDEAVIKFISSSNVACGFHAGDPHVMMKTVSMAKENGVAVGAHPGLPDLIGFGRRDLRVSPQELKDYFIYQIGALKSFVEAMKMSLQHVKPHGVLLKMALEDEKLGLAMVEATKEVNPKLIFVTNSGLPLVDIAQGCGVKVAKEAYADRAYYPDKTLVSRKLSGSVIQDPKQIETRIEQLIGDGTVMTIDGKTLELEFDTIALHGDTPGASDIVKIIRGKLDDLAVSIRSMGEILL
jgi:UPF0271 protein